MNNLIQRLEKLKEYLSRNQGYLIDEAISELERQSSIIAYYEQFNESMSDSHWDQDDREDSWY